MRHIYILPLYFVPRPLQTEHLRGSWCCKCICFRLNLFGRPDRPPHRCKTSCTLQPGYPGLLPHTLKPCFRRPTHRMSERRHWWFCSPLNQRPCRYRSFQPRFRLYISLCRNGRWRLTAVLHCRKYLSSITEHISFREHPAGVNVSIGNGVGQVLRSGPCRPLRSERCPYNRRCNLFGNIPRCCLK